MSCQENDKIYEDAYEDFYELYFTSSSFATLVEQLSGEYYDLDMTFEALLGSIFDALWKNDCELLVRDKRTAVEALIMWNKSKKQLLK